MNALDVIGWWERRRLFFNLVLGGSGIVCCTLILLCALVSSFAPGEPIGLPDGPVLGIFAIVAYAIVANVCYTAGWILELAVRSKLTQDRAAAFALKTFRFGIQFSVALTLLPAAICWISLVVMLITGRPAQEHQD